MKSLHRTLLVTLALTLLAGCASQHDSGYSRPSGGYHTSQNIWETRSQCVKNEPKPYQRNYLTQREKETGIVSRSYSPGACTYGNPRYSTRAMNRATDRAMNPVNRASHRAEKSPTAQRAQIAQMALGAAAIGALVNHNDRGQGALVGAGIGALAGVAIQ